jgi:hypothetical protein
VPLPVEDDLGRLVRALQGLGIRGRAKVPAADGDQHARYLTRHRGARHNSAQGGGQCEAIGFAADGGGYYT